MNHLYRAPTLRMISKLQECFNKNDGKPFLAKNMKSSLSGLYKRGFIETRMEMVNEKEMLCVHVSSQGKKFLSGLKKNS